MRKFWRFVFRKLGWRYVRTVPQVPKSVICLAPHTSNWDFIMAKMAYLSFEREQPSFFMKKEWFFFPISLILNAMGGIPINRNKKTSMTDLIAEEFAKHAVFHLALTPEGTRKAVSEWKKGFYYIALKAGVPIQLAYLDYSKKEAGIGELFYPTGNETEDFAKIKQFYSQIKGRFPARFIV